MFVKSLQETAQETVISDIEIETEPPCQLFGVIPHPVDVPLKEGDEVLNFTMCLLGSLAKFRLSFIGL